MKPIQFALTLAMVVVPAIVLAAPVNPPTFVQGDILMGFRATGGAGVADTYVVNIGHASTYRDATAPVVATIGNIEADLVAIYGTEWRNREDLFWGIAGCSSNIEVINGDPARTLYVSRGEVSPNTPGEAWNGLTSTDRGNVATRMQTMTSIASGFRSYERSTNSNYAVSEGSSDPSSWSAFMGGGSQTTGLLDFDSFFDIEALPAKTLSLFRVYSASNPSTYEGYFSISNAGVLTFTPATSTGVTYAAWAATNAGGQTQDLDFDGDGVSNGIEFFMGESGSTFTVNPQVSATNTITWPRATDRTVSSVVVQTSTDLVTWNPAASGAVYNAGSVVYTVPSGQGKHFIRLSVTP